MTVSYHLGNYGKSKLCKVLDFLNYVQKLILKIIQLKFELSNSSNFIVKGTACHFTILGCRKDLKKIHLGTSRRNFNIYDLFYLTKLKN